jgi:hypothetical protein
MNYVLHMLFVTYRCEDDERVNMVGVSGPSMAIIIDRYSTSILMHSIVRATGMSTSII